MRANGLSFMKSDFKKAPQVSMDQKASRENWLRLLTGQVIGDTP